MSSLTVAHRQPNESKILVAVMGIQHMFILEEVGPVAQMEEGHHNGRLFGAACLLRQPGPCFDQLGSGRHIIDSLDVLGWTFEQSF
jgi:hypothetical protein